jgi:hypothetical protein
MSNELRKVTPSNPRSWAKSDRLRAVSPALGFVSALEISAVASRPINAGKPNDLGRSIVFPNSLIGVAYAAQE